MSKRLSIEEYAKTLIEHKDKELSLLWYLGARWMVVKLLLLAIGIYAFYQPFSFGKGAGIFVFGYLFGTIAFDLRAYLLAKHRWSMQQELYDWNKIDHLSQQPAPAPTITKTKSDDDEVKGEI